MIGQMTIAGHVYTVPAPYAEGDTINAAEAAALNQTFAENVRNNLRDKAKAAADAGTPLSQEAIDEAFASYAFGVRRTRGPNVSADPVGARALDILVEKVRNAMASKGIKLFKKNKDGTTNGGVTMEQVRARAKSEYDKDPDKWRALAQRQIDDEASLGDLDVAA